MNLPPEKKLPGLAWLVLSPLAVLMALLSTIESPSVYYAQVVLFGAWSLLGMLSGVGLLLRAAWAPRIKNLLVFAAASYFSIAGVVMVAFVVAWLVSGREANPTLGWFISVVLFILLLAIFIRARNRRKPRVASSSDA